MGLERRQTKREEYDIYRCLVLFFKMEFESNITLNAFRLQPCYQVLLPSLQFCFQGKISGCRVVQTMHMLTPAREDPLLTLKENKVDFTAGRGNIVFESNISKASAFRLQKMKSRLQFEILKFSIYVSMFSAQF